MKSRLTAFVFPASCIFLVAACNRPADFTGFWKVNCTDAFGVQIKKQPANLFSVSFCGPGGCFAPGEWLPNTPIVGDPKYRVLNPTTIEIRHEQGWTRYTRCTTDTNPPLDYATMPAPNTGTSSGTASEPNRATVSAQTEKDVPILANADKGKVAWQGADKPVYVVTENHYAEGFTPDGDTARFGDLIAIEIFNPKASPTEEDAVYKVGERLALFVGGQRTGDVKISKVMPLQCDSSAALVSADPHLHLAKDAMALATNAGKIRPHANSQRQADDGEQKYARQLAMNAFRKHGVPEELAKGIKVDQLIVTKVDESESKLVIGSLYVEAKGVRHEVFLIGKLDSSGATTELARYHKTTDLEEGTDSENMRFVDQLDLDGDGTDEIVVEVTGYENEEFGIYKRRNGLWSKVHLGGQGGC
jgi:hypothetical protein